MQRYLCIHGHFYQPPRENPWLEAIELQDSAAPFHDWNERITAECYARNAHARILDEAERIVRLVNNYADISFNFGPTLLSWLARHAPETYAAIRAADAESRRRHAGHGSALAQAYHHLILPLASRRDKQSEIRWGVRDFERRFERAPEGLWLPETAVDLETLELLADHGLRFTILSPRQAHRVRRLGGRSWRELEPGSIDPTRAYAARLPSGRPLVLFFYDAAVSAAVAFERLLDNGELFAQRLLSGFSAKSDHPQLMHIATDGESYGHHHRFGEMALAYALEHIRAAPEVHLTNYGAFLERHPPTHEVEIAENTAWSCGHGLGRWSQDCGCRTGQQPDWSQAWRGPLRAALDWLRDEVAPRYEAAARAAGLADPWAARDEYVDVLYDRRPAALASFLAQHAPGAAADASHLRRLLELQRHTLLMYTSCGWFFDDLAGIETIQVVQYAARVLQLALTALDVDLEPGFLARLAEARGNRPDCPDGRVLFERFVRPARVDSGKVAAHYALCSLCEEPGDELELPGYHVRREWVERHEAPPARLVVGRVVVTSRATGEADRVTYAALHPGDHNLIGGVRTSADEAADARLCADAAALLARAAHAELVDLLNQAFQAATYSLHSLFRDEQRRLLAHLLAEQLREAESAHRRLRARGEPLMHFLARFHTPAPRAFLASVEFVLNVDLRRALDAEVADLDRVRALLAEAARWPGIELDAAGLGFALAGALERQARVLRSTPGDPGWLKSLRALAEFAEDAPFPVDLSETQNLYEQIRSTIRSAAPPSDAAGSWQAEFEALGRALRFRVEP